MKLDTIRFAQVVSYISSNFNMALSYGMIEDLNDLIDFDVPAPVEAPAPAYGKVSEADVNKLLETFVAGNSKIEAIKAYRNLTGAGLKESKDAIEKYSPPRSDQMSAKDYQFNLLDKVYTANSKDPDADRHILDGFSDHQLRKIYDYISSFTTYK